MAKRKSKMERELEGQDRSRLRNKRRAWAELVRDCKKNVRETATCLKKEEKELAEFIEGLRILDKVLASRKRKVKA